MPPSLDHPPLPIYFENDRHGRRLREACEVWERSSPARRSRILSQIRASTHRIRYPSLDPDEAHR